MSISLEPFGLSIVDSITGSYSVSLPDSNLGAEKKILLQYRIGDPITISTSQGSFIVSPSIPERNLVFTGNPSWSFINSSISSFFPTLQQSGPLVGTGATGVYQGSCVALSADGTLLVIGGLVNSGDSSPIWIFNYIDGRWIQSPSSPLNIEGYIGGADQGRCLALSGDKTTLVVGDPGYNKPSPFSGAVFVYNLVTNTTILLTQNVVSGNVGLGYSVAISTDGSTIVAGGPIYNNSSGSVWIWNSNTLYSGSPLIGSGTAYYYFGSSVALSSVGNLLAVGAAGSSGVVNQYSGATWIYNYNGSTWGGYTSNPLVGNNYTYNMGINTISQGIDVSLSANGTVLAVGGYQNGETGGTWIFYYNSISQTWTQYGTGPLIGSGYTGTNIYQGYSVSLSVDGNTLAIGGYQNNSNVGGVWIFTYDTVYWSQQGPGPLISKGTPTGLNQGYSVSLSSNGGLLAEGARYTSSDNGAVWIFV